MANFLLIHGGWAGSWQWERTIPFLRKHGHTVCTPALTGLGERAALTHPEISLSTHISDVCEVIENMRLQDIYMVGFSYGGMIAAGVSEKHPEKIRKVIFLDAFVPKNGQALFQIFGPSITKSLLEITDAFGDGWRVPHFDTYDSRLTDQPIETAREKVYLTEEKSGSVPSCYIECTEKAPEWSFTPVLQKISADWRDSGRPYYTIASDHFPMDTMPEALSDLLDSITAE